MDEGPFAEQIRTIFGPKGEADGKRYTATHAAIARFGFRALVTTNYLAEAGREGRLLLPLDEQRRGEFLEKWFRHAGRDDWRKEAKEAKEALAHVTASRGLRALSGIPLYLTLLAVLWEQQPIPASRTVWKAFGTLPNARPNRPEGVGHIAKPAADRPEDVPTHFEGLAGRPEDVRASAKRVADRPEGVGHFAKRALGRPVSIWQSAQPAADGPEETRPSAEYVADRPEATYTAT